MNLSRNLQSLVAVGAPPAAASGPSLPRLPAGRLTAATRRGLTALGITRDTNYTRRDLAAALRWLST